MKLIPQAISRQIARQGLLASKNAPTVLFGAGVVGMIGSTVLACRATLKLEDILSKTQRDLDTARTIQHREYSEQDRKMDTAIIYRRAVTTMVKMYTPSVVLGVASVACLTKSHTMLKDRNLALAAAYTAVDTAFKQYRARVVEKYGEDEDRDLRYSSEVVDVIDDETGKVMTSIRVDQDAASQYARWFDSECSPWSKEPEYNILFLRTQQNWWNNVLAARGHVFLNEVYESLGLSHTKAGAVTGWIRKSNGDGYIDFGIWDGTDQALDFFNGREGSILLDFNVDGLIYDRLDESMEAQRWGT